MRSISNWFPLFYSTFKVNLLLSHYIRNIKIKQIINFVIQVFISQLLSLVKLNFQNPREVNTSNVISRNLFDQMSHPVLFHLYLYFQDAPVMCRRQILITRKDTRRWGEEKKETVTRCGKARTNYSHITIWSRSEKLPGQEGRRFVYICVWMWSGFSVADLIKFEACSYPVLLSSGSIGRKPETDTRMHF